LTTAPPTPSPKWSPASTPSPQPPATETSPPIAPLSPMPRPAEPPPSRSETHGDGENAEPECSNSTLAENRSAAKATDRCRPLHRPPTTGECHDTTPRSSTHPVNRRQRRPAPPRHPLHHLPARCADRRHPNRTKHHARSPSGTHQQDPR